MSELSSFGLVVLLVAGGFALAVLSTKLTERIPIPAPAIFLCAAAAVSDLRPSLYDDVPIVTVERIAVVALIVILFNGGAEIGWRRFRADGRPIVLLGVAGTFATALGLALVARYVLGFDWKLAGLIGAAVAPTDPAVMFSVLGRREIAGRSGTTLKGEAGVNDPAGIALMLAVIELATHPGSSVLSAAGVFGLEMAVGAAVGVAGGAGLVWSLRRVRLPSEAMYPLLGLMLAGCLYGAATVAHGSGFLAVFFAGLVFGDARLPYKGEIERFQVTLASLAEIAVFVGLGLTVNVAQLGADIWLEGTVLTFALALAVRPVVVAATLAGSGLSRSERIFVAWSGLKGAVPILLAAFAVLEPVADADHLYGLVFVIVLLSVVGQGTLVPAVARRLGIEMRVRDPMPWEVSIRLGGEPGAHEFSVQRRSRAEGASIRDLPLGESAWVTLVVRGDAALEPDAALRLSAGDRVLVLAEPDDVGSLAPLFRPGSR